MSGQRRRLTSGAWRELMRRFDGGSATVGEFCAREGVSVSSFYRWRALMDVSDDPAVGAGNALPTLGARGRRNVGVAPAFIDLGTLTGPLGAAGGTGKPGNDGAFELRLELGAGVVLHLSRH